ncbi:MAG: hypothetical protein DMG08_12155 [Acidobacteria bacterium]|nr:MAG: hypothetical protein DMG08_12155 [Acidobacteriota bacterium]PYV00911.1 MAG: hypothetical protein DMG10_19335 [Acidobacteriota bacterium]
MLAGKDFSSRNLRALRGFAVSPGLDFPREGAKHAKKTRRTLVWLRPGCSVFICGFIHTFGMAPLLGEIRGRLFQFVRSACARGSRGWGRRVHPAG